MQSGVSTIVIPSLSYARLMYMPARYQCKREAICSREDKVRCAANEDAIQVAWSDAKKRPLIPRRLYSKKYSQFVSVAGYLQLAKPQAAIFLPIERIGELLGCDHKMISTYRKFAIAEEILELTAEAVPHKRAAEFRFSLPMFNFETGEQVR